MMSWLPVSEIKPHCNLKTKEQKINPYILIFLNFQVYIILEISNELYTEYTSVPILLITLYPMV
jgi:hypothetical protein